jgi:hypothetical protein
MDVAKLSKWFVPAVAFVIGLLMAAAELGGRATPLQAGIAFAIVAGYALGLRLLQSKSDTANLLSGLPVDERWVAINNQALALAAQVIAIVLLGCFLVARFSGGDGSPYALLEVVFAVAYLGGILWFRWRQ